MAGEIAGQRPAVLCDGAISAAAWASSTPHARDELVRRRGWFLCVRGALLADVFALDDALVGLILALLSAASDTPGGQVAGLERRLRRQDGLGRKTILASPLVRRLHASPDALLSQLDACAELEALMRAEPCWFAPAGASVEGAITAHRLMIGRDAAVREVDEAAAQAWGALLTSTRAQVETLRVAGALAARAAAPALTSS